MPKNVTVTFQDGSTHIYQGVPDNATPQQVQSRAEAEFKQPVQHLDGGNSASAAPPQQTNLLDTLGKAWGPQGQIDNLKRMGADFMQPVHDANAKVAADSNVIFNRSLPDQLSHSVGDTGTLLSDAAQYFTAPINGAVHAIVAPFTRRLGSAAYNAGLPVGQNEQQAQQNVDTGVGAAGALGSMFLGNESGAAKAASELNAARNTLKGVNIGDYDAAASGAVPSVVTTPVTTLKASPQAVSRVASAVGRYLGKDNVSTDQYRQALTGAPEGALPYDLAGPNVRSQAEAVAQSPGPGQAILSDAAQTRQGQAVTRMKQQVGQAVGGQGNYFDTLDNLAAQRAQDAKAGMDQIGTTQVPLDQNSVMALRSDLVKNAVKDEALNKLASLDPEDRNVGAMLNGLHDQVLDNPSGAKIDINSAQNITKALYDQGQNAYSSGNSARGKTLVSLSKALRQNVRDQVPEYDSWLKNYSDSMGQQDALNTGRDALGGNLGGVGKLPFEQLQQSVKGFSPDQQIAFNKGLGESLFGMVREKGPAAFNNLLKTEDNADRLRLAFPTDEHFNNFVDFVNGEKGFANNDRSLFGGSQTSLRASTKADLNAEPTSVAEHALTGAEAVIAPHTIPLKLAKLAIRKFASPQSILANDETNGLLGKALSDPETMHQILNVVDNGNKPISAPASMPSLSSPVAIAAPGAAALLQLPDLRTSQLVAAAQAKQALQNTRKKTQNRLKGTQ